MSSVTQIKQQLRLSFLHQLNNRDSENGSHEIQEALKNILTDLPLPRGKVGVFLPLSTEPAIQSLWSEPQSNFRSIEWCFPKVTAKGTITYFCSSTEFIRSSQLGVLEPVDGSEVSLDKIDCVLVPGLSFDSKGFRLGRGQGFFDRLLSQFSGVSIGVAFEEQVVEELECNDWDQPVSLLVTESQVRDFRKAE